MKADHLQGTITERCIHAAQVLFAGAAERRAKTVYFRMSRSSRGRRAGSKVGKLLSYKPTKPCHVRGFRSSPGWTRTNNPPVNSSLAIGHHRSIWLSHALLDQVKWSSSPGGAYLASFGFRAFGWHRLFSICERPDGARCVAACGAAAASGVVLPFRLDYVVKISTLRRLGGVTLGSRRLPSRSSPSASRTGPGRAPCGSLKLVPDLVPTSAERTAPTRHRGYGAVRDRGPTHPHPQTFKTGEVWQPQAG